MARKAGNDGKKGRSGNQARAGSAARRPKAAAAPRKAGIEKMRTLIDSVDEGPHLLDARLEIGRAHV